VRKEMGWTRGFFKYHRDQWKQRRQESQRAGLRSYAARRMQVWAQLDEYAGRKFGGILILD
jgi:hypothetical protein